MRSAFLHSRLSRVGRTALVLLLPLSLAPCTDHPTRPASIATLQLSADVGSTMVATLVVEVTAPDISPPLMFNLTLVDGVASGTIHVPAGSDRLLTIRAFDTEGIETHRGSRVLALRAGVNPNVTVTLTPIQGDQPIEVRIGSITMTVAPSAPTMFVGQTLQLQATVRDAENNVVTPPAGAVRWATLNPGLVTVDANGLVTALDQGSVSVVATYAGVGASANVTVQHGVVFVGAGDIASCTDPNDELTAELLDDIPGTVYTLGDNAYIDGTFQEFMDCYDPTWGRHKARTYPVTGNHDYHDPTASGYFDYFGAVAGDRDKGYYSFNLGDWHIIALNSNIAINETSPQYLWLKADLAANPARCTLAMWHHARFSSGSVHGSRNGMAPFWRALQEAGADVVLTGHEHNYERFTTMGPSGLADPVNGMREFVVGTGGGDLYPFATPLATSEFRYDQRHGVLKLELAPDRYYWSFITTPNAEVVDSGMTFCH